MKSLSLSILLFSLSLFAPQFASACELGDLLGTYVGDIEGGGRDSETTFARNGNGGLQGSYVLSDYPDSPGRLSQITLRSNVMTAAWSDVGGSGRVRFEFAQDCMSFRGQWWGNRPHYWNGEKR